MSMDFYRTMMWCIIQKVVLKLFSPYTSFYNICLSKYLQYKTVKKGGQYYTLQWSDHFIIIKIMRLFISQLALLIIAL